MPEELHPKMLSTLLMARQAMDVLLVEVLVDKGVITANALHARLATVADEVAKSDIGVAGALIFEPALQFLEEKYNVAPRRTV